MKLILKLAWRNIWRNWRRSVLTIAAISFAVFLSAFMRGMQHGSYKQNIETMTGIFTGFLQIQEDGFHENPSLRKSFKISDEMRKDIKSVEHIEGYAPRINSYGLAGYRDKTFGSAIFGLDPSLEKDVSTIDERVIKGDFISNRRKYDVVIGYKMFKNLKGQSSRDTMIIVNEGMLGDTLLAGKSRKEVNKFTVIIEDMLGDTLIIMKEKFELTEGFASDSLLKIRYYAGKGFFESAGERWLPGKSMAGRQFPVMILPLQIGDEIVVLANGYDGSMGNLKFTIAGISKMGNDEFDKMSIFMSLEAAQELLYMYGRYNTIAINIDDINNLQTVKTELKSVAKEHSTEKTKLAVLDWEELMPEFKQSIEFDNVSGLLFLALLIAVVAFGILNTLLMSVTERFKEFGVMLALGTKQSTLLNIIFIETLFIALISITIGTLAAWAGNYYVMLNPIPIPGDSGEMMKEFGFEPYMYSSVDFSIFLNNILVIFITILLAFIYPAVKLFKLEPLKGIRYT